MNKIEHIGIAVKNLDEAIKNWETLLGAPCYKKESVASEKVDTAFFRTGESKIELLGARAPDSVIAGFIEKRGEGMHHVAFEVDDIRAEMKRLSEAGYRLLQEEPKRGADNKLVAFLHPKNANGVLVELCQSIEGE
ncbi:MAG: methylmalonyl-CoA epimerase [Balneolia bacterium]|nr:methylmalonyl-CoA epimerase [Balneolia bacterium]